MSTQIVKSDILKARQAADICGLGLSTLYRYANAGALPAIRIGRSLRFRRESLERFMAQQEARAFQAQPAESAR